MKELKFYKYFECAERKYHFWETTNNVSNTIAAGHMEEIKTMLPNSAISITQNPIGYCRINVKLYNDEDNAAFCLVVGSN